MTEPMSCCAARHATERSYCLNCDLLVGLEGYHVVGVQREPDLLTVRVESPSDRWGARPAGSLPARGDGGPDAWWIHRVSGRRW